MVYVLFMKWFKFVLLFFIVLVLGCQKNVEEIGNSPGMSCQVHADCQTPVKYLVMSNCPHYSLCVENKCAVVCLRVLNSAEDQNHPTVVDPNYFSPPVNCSTSIDCVERCTEGFGSSCACVEGNCYYIVE